MKQNEVDVMQQLDSNDLSEGGLTVFVLIDSFTTTAHN
jgi:hypothetical protein